MPNVITSALVSVDMAYPYSPEQPGFFVGSLNLGEMRTERDGTSTLYVRSEQTGMCTHTELTDTDLFAAVEHLYPVAEQFVQDERDYAASLERYRADRLARGLAPNQW